MSSNSRPIRIAVLILATAALGSLAGCDRVLLDERFHDNRLTRWTVIDDPDCVEGPSRWEVGGDGWLHQRSNIWGRRGDFIGRWYGTFLVAGSPDWRDYTFSLKARPGDNDGFGVVFRFEDSEHFYRLMFLDDGLSGGPITRLDKREGPDYTQLWSSNEGYREGKERAIEIRVIDDLITARVDQHILCEVRDKSYRRGRIGLFCYAQNGQAFDDVKVEEN
jgi:hypothetical protein